VFGGEETLGDRFGGRIFRIRRLGLAIHFVSAGLKGGVQAIFRFSSFASISGGVDRNCEGSVKGDRREPHQRACPLTGSSQFRFRSRGSERRHWMRGILFACFIAQLARAMSACVAFCAKNEVVSRLALLLAAAMEP
jgi:hypothetical protein